MAPPSEFRTETEMACSTECEKELYWVLLQSRQMGLHSVLKKGSRKGLVRELLLVSVTVPEKVCR